MVFDVVICFSFPEGCWSLPSFHYLAMMEQDLGNIQSTQIQPGKIKMQSKGI